MHTYIDSSRWQKTYKIAFLDFEKRRKRILECLYPALWVVTWAPDPHRKNSFLVGAQWLQYFMLRL